MDSAQLLGSCLSTCASCPASDCVRYLCTGSRAQAPQHLCGDLCSPAKVEQHQPGLPIAALMNPPHRRRWALRRAPERGPAALGFRGQPHHQNNSSGSMLIYTTDSRRKGALLFGFRQEQASLQSWLWAPKRGTSQDPFS